ncbi:uncharacterized protein LOC143367956 [Andrena cerasifolii]|uniref:uncharacterized protein LOC143367956 n=1 Tax=Andrena cerasifolii TaxID=2819439 RepID=UPI004037C117
MATFLSTRYWKSDDSLKIFGETSSSKLDLSKSPENRQKDRLVSVPPRKQITFLKPAPKPKSLNSKGGSSMTPKGYEDEFLEPSHVKVSALLYEITERTNQLAQPRVRSGGRKLLQPRQIASQIPEASQRIIELSKPRTIHQRTTKDAGYVSPSALTAVATQRIIELSRPKKKRRLKLSKKRKFGYLSVNSRVHSKLCGGKSWCRVCRARKKSDREYGAFCQSKNCRRIKKKKIARRKQDSARSSNSNRTIIMVDLSPRKDSRTKSKRTRHG